MYQTGLHPTPESNYKVFWGLQILPPIYPIVCSDRPPHHQCVKNKRGGEAQTQPACWNGQWNAKWRLRNWNTCLQLNRCWNTQTQTPHSSFRWMLVMQQNDQGALQPCAHTSKQRWWAVWEKEAYLVHWVLLICRHFQEGAKHCSRCGLNIKTWRL